LEDLDAKAYPKYFEHHIKLKHKTAADAMAIKPEESEELLKVSQKFSK